LSDHEKTPGYLDRNANATTEARTSTGTRPAATKPVPYPAPGASRGQDT